MIWTWYLPFTGQQRGRASPAESRARAIPAIVLGVTLVAGTLLMRLWIGPGLTVCWCLVFVPLLAAMLLARPLDIRGLKELEAADWRLCLHCRYPLVVVDSSGELYKDWLCPECGRTWKDHDLKTAWRWTYKNLIDMQPTKVWSGDDE